MDYERGLEGGLKVTCKYCEAVGIVPPAKSTGFVPHEPDCPLMVAEQYLNEPRNLS